MPYARACRRWSDLWRTGPRREGTVQPILAGMTAGVCRPEGIRIGGAEVEFLRFVPFPNPLNVRSRRAQFADVLRQLSPSNELVTGACRGIAMGRCDAIHGASHVRPRRCVTPWSTAAVFCCGLIVLSSFLYQVWSCASIFCFCAVLQSAGSLNTSSRMFGRDHLLLGFPAGAGWLLSRAWTARPNSRPAGASAVYSRVSLDWWRSFSVR